jgi:hypothetical protein
MLAWKHLITWLLHQLKTIFTSAYIFKSLFHTRWCLFQFIFTESARASIFLITSLTNMIWFWFAFRTEILFTLITSYTIFSHMFWSFIWN